MEREGESQFSEKSVLVLQLLIIQRVVTLMHITQRMLFSFTQCNIKCVNLRPKEKHKTKILNKEKLKDK
jgi:hypothetical protein